MNGVINVYKEQGFTSFDVVAKLKGILHTRKIGHTGTLDPLATGVLPICVGNATGLVTLLTEKDKTYKATLKLGITTDTLDITGKVLSDKTCDVSGITLESFSNAALSFVGEYNQLPPMYSALKVNGKKLYEYAREGKIIERKTRTVKIYSIEILNFDGLYVSIRVSCSKGTYVRSLIDDIGNKLGCGATMTSLEREKTGDFLIKDSYSLNDIESMVKNENYSFLIPVDKILYTYDSFTIKEEFQKQLSNGNRLPVNAFVTVPDTYEDMLIKVYDSFGDFAAVYKYSLEKDAFITEKMFKRY